jgi:hypothetical protein
MPHGLGTAAPPGMVSPTGAAGPAGAASLARCGRTCPVARLQSKSPPLPWAQLG